MRDAPDYDMAVTTWKHRPFPYGNVWANDAIQAARLGLGDEALKGLSTMLQKYQSYPNGMTDNTNGVFEYLGVHLSVINEALLQSHDGKVRVFPAMPSESGFVGRFMLMAKGGFLVSSEKDGTDIKYVGVKSTRGGSVTLVNPWGTAAVRVWNAADGSTVSTASTAEVGFDTVPSGVYIVERMDKPFSGFTYAQISGTRNTSQKSLAGTPCMLGLPSN